MNLAWEANLMSSFSVRAIGYLARNPELVITDGGAYCRFCLKSEDYTEDDEQGQFTVTFQSVWFVATHMVGAAIADSARKGDQLFVEGKIRRHHWTGKGRNEDTTLVVTGFRFGARRGGPGAEGATAFGQTPKSPLGAAEESVLVAG
jgi:single-stranded DNA-binding protein